MQARRRVEIVAGASGADPYEGYNLFAPLGETGLSVALAGLLGIVVTLAVMAGITWYVRGRRTSDA